MKELKKNTLFSYAVICGVYILAAVIAIVVVKVMHSSMWVEFLVSDLIATIIVFIFSTVFSNASVYDPYWSVAPMVTVIVLIFSSTLNFQRFMILAVILGWGVRLTYNWAYRFGSLAHEDWRYARFRKNTGSLFHIISFAGFHLFPTIVVFLCMLPVTAAFSTDGHFSLLSIFFLLIAIGAIIIEAYADYHMNLFKKDLADGYVSGCCRYGLWRNSRHPNYFGEILFWWAVYFMILFYIPGQWYLFIGPLVNTLMFWFISIPLAEGRLSHKGGYKRYRASTHTLLPLPKSSK